ncbi:MAG: SAF domain-containing protein [Propioniciclava sp.]
MSTTTAVARRPRVRIRRHPGWLLGGIIAVCLGGLVSASLVMTVANTEQVLAVATTVHRGEQIEATDLRVVSLGAADALSPVMATEADAVVGQTALVDLAQGSLLVTGSYGEDPLPADRVRLGLRLTPGRYPLGLVAGSQVLVIALEEADPHSSMTATLAGAPVANPDGSVLINLIMTADESEIVSRLAAVDQVALAEEGPKR